MQTIVICLPHYFVLKYFSAWEEKQELSVDEVTELAYWISETEKGE